MVRGLVSWTEPIFPGQCGRGRGQMLEDIDIPLASREPPGLLLPTVHKPQGPPLVGSGPNFGDSVTLDVPSTLPGEPATATSCPKRGV